MRLHILSLAACLLLGSVGVHAGVKGATTLCIENKKGEVIEVSLADCPKLSFRGDYLVVQTSKIQVLKFKDQHKAYFVGDASAINAPELSQAAISAQANTVTLRGFAAGLAVRVYTPAGMMVKKDFVAADGTLQISTGDLQRGTYIVKAGQTAFKVYRN